MAGPGEFDLDVLLSVSHCESGSHAASSFTAQVGGLVGGVKLTVSPGKLPLRIDVEQVGATDDFVKTFGEHLVLIYTGKTRLARNLLQNVVRNWYVCRVCVFVFSFFASRVDDVLQQRGGGGGGSRRAASSAYSHKRPR